MERVEGAALVFKTKRVGGVCSSPPHKAWFRGDFLVCFVPREGWPDESCLVKSFRGGTKCLVLARARFVGFDRRQGN